MDALLVGFAVYFVITTGQRFITLPRWMWPPLALGTGIGLMFLTDSPWWMGISAAGISTFVNGLEALLLAYTDRAMFDLPRQSNRR
jgi:integral membrane sensor domain MASE1